jgi:hypothetical protein
MTNPKSPHAASNSPTPKVLGPQTGMPLGDKLGFPIIPPKKSKTTGTEYTTYGGPSPQPVIIPKKNKSTQVKTDAELKILNRVAVEQIFNSYWYGWKDGCPEVFNKIFMKFGNFVHFSVKPSSMVGTPDFQLSTINSSGHRNFALYVSMMTFESKGAIMRKFQEASPLLAEILHGVSPQDAMAILENNGNSYKFSKVGNGDVYTYDDNGHSRSIPRWAIA